MAKRYTFRFETLLRLRQQREEQQHRVVAQRLAGIRRLQDRRQTLLRRIDEQTSMTRGTLQDRTIDVDLLKLGRHWLIRLRRGVLETDAELAAQKALLAQERVNLSEAAKQRKILSRLKDRRRDRHIADETRRQQAELDEMSIMRFARARTTPEVHHA